MTKTKAFKTSMTVMKGGDIPSYTLEHLTKTKKRKPGDYETIVLPYIEIGRSNNCVVSFGNDASTVSRKHAAIEKRNGDYFLLQLSETNPTLINGKPIAKEWSLSNGDEIQLSLEGPMLRFNVSPSGTSGMGFTRKIGLVTRQALRPYKTMVVTLLIFIIALGGIGGYFLYQGNVKNKKLQASIIQADSLRIADSIRYAETLNETSRLIDHVRNENIKLNRVIEAQKTKITDLSHELENVKDEGQKLYELFKDDVYFLEVAELFATFPNGEVYYPEDYSWIGTAFLTKDGKLITARHCIQGWRYGLNDEARLLNYAELNGGKVFVKYIATSANNRIEFDYNEVHFNDKEDVVYTDMLEDGSTYVLKYGSDFTNNKNYELNATDWAYLETTLPGNIERGPEIVEELSPGSKLFILGFSLGLGGPQEGQVKPLYSESSVAMKASEPGIITITNRNFESGNSGGPVFAKQGDKYYAIGIVTRSELEYSGARSEIGGVVSIKNLN